MSKDIKKLDEHYSDDLKKILYDLVDFTFKCCDVVYAGDIREPLTAKATQAIQALLLEARYGGWLEYFKSKPVERAEMGSEIANYYSQAATNASEEVTQIIAQLNKTKG